LGGEAVVFRNPLKSGEEQQLGDGKFEHKTGGRAGASRQLLEIAGLYMLLELGRK
jgi:hypothetical protein